MSFNISDLNHSFHSISITDTLHLLSSSIDGLSNVEVKERHSITGDNLINSTHKSSIIICFFSQFKDFMTIILILAAIISFFASIIEGNPDYIDPAIILLIIIFNAILGTLQEAKAENSLEALKKLSAPNSSVYRDGLITTIPSKELVPGDIILLEPGHFVPADCRIIEASSLYIDESSLTGESNPICKNADTIIDDKAPLADRYNMAYSSCIVTSGHGKAVVTSIGINTEVGSIAKMITEDQSPQTPLQLKLAKTSKILGITAITICLFIFIVGTITGKPIFDMFMTSVSLAVASIPEGLLIFITIMLSLGVTRMAKKNAIIRKLPAVETLGSASYICSDKTGTLTQNKMTVTSINGPQGEITSPEFILTLASLCNNSKICANSTDSFSSTNICGEPTENALLKSAIDNNIHINQITNKYKRIYELPFDSKKKIMTTVHTLTTSSIRCISKGAPDILLNNCNKVLILDKVVPLDNNYKKNIINQNNTMAKQALRVIAVAYKDTTNSDIDYEHNMIFVGLIGMIDPPRKNVEDSVKKCISAGITPVMITGDHPLTACAIASQIGILSSNGKYVTGSQLDKFDDNYLNKHVTDYSVFARVTPYHKVRIVKALQFNGHVVAMTGDGVNDAPALKAADIGCSMGLSGTDVAKNASDMILADDNFSTIVDAIKEGRGIYSNIKKSIHFLLSSNIGEIITILIAILFNLPTPLLAVQLLWINLVTDSLPAVALGTEPIDREVMNHKPIDKNSSLFSKDLVFQIITEGMMIGSLALIAFIIGYKYYPLTLSNVSTNASNNLIIARTMSFAVLGLSQLFHAFNMKSEHSLLKSNILNNFKLIISFFVCVCLQVFVISMPFAAKLFDVAPLNILGWIIVFVLSFMPIIIVELQKKLREPH